MTKIEEIEKKRYSTGSRKDMEDICKDINYLIARVKKLEAALQFYADKSNWEDLYDEHFEGDIAHLMDIDDVEIRKNSDGSLYYSCAGKRAREALEEE